MQKMDKVLIRGEVSFIRRSFVTAVVIVIVADLNVGGKMKVMKKGRRGKKKVCGKNETL
jgi:hypothetical protein